MVLTIVRMSDYKSCCPCTPIPLNPLDETGAEMPEVLEQVKSVAYASVRVNPRPFLR